MWLFSEVPKDSEDCAVIQYPGVDTIYSAVKVLMHAILTEDKESLQDCVHQIIHIAKPRMIRRWSESKLANGRPVAPIQQENAHLIDFDWTEDKEVTLKTLVE